MPVDLIGMFDKILALDLGGNTGWAMEANKVITSGSENFKSTRFESSGMKFLKFKKWLSEMLSIQKPEIVVYEQVHRHMGTAAAHSYGAYLGILQATCEERSLPYAGIDVGTIKKFFSGSGSADKFAMIAEAKKRFPDHTITSSDQADALAILETGKHQLNENKK